ncbi:MAG: glycosyltransferase family 39 protein [Patescibacteria group bacterium]|jgi:hypothetical protein
MAKKIFLNILTVASITTSVFIILRYFILDIDVSNNFPSFFIQIFPNRSHSIHLESIGTVFSLNSTVLHYHPSIIFSMIYFVIVITATTISKRRNLRLIRISPTFLLIVFLLGFFLNTLLWALYLDSVHLINVSIFALTALKLCSELALILLSATAIGYKILKISKLHESDSILKTFLLSFGIGVIFIVYCIFALIIFGLATQPMIVAVCLVILTVSYKELGKIARIFFSRKIKLDLPLRLPNILLALIVIIFLYQNYLELLRPLPIGHDEMETYLNTARLIAANGKLIAGIFDYPWEIFTSLGFFFSSTSALPRMITSTASVFASLAIYLVISSYGKSRKMDSRIASLFATVFSVLFFTLPAVVFQATTDLKVDLAGTFYSVISLICMIDYHRTKNSRLLLISFLFSGFAFTIKYTFILFLIPLLILLVSSWIKNKMKFKPLIGCFCMLVLLFILPSLPFGIKNILQTHNPGSYLAGAPVATVPFAIEAEPEGGASAKEGKITQEESTKQKFGQSTQNELERYRGKDKGSKIFTILYTPFEATFGNSGLGQYTDIGFVLLAPLPFIIPFCYLALIMGKDYHLIAILALASAYWVPWLVFGSGIIWYGFGGFVLLFLVYLELDYVAEVNNIRYFRFIAAGYCSLWLFIAFTLRVAHLPEHNPARVTPQILQFAGSHMGEQEYFKQTLPKFYDAANIINTTISNDQLNRRTYLVSKYLKYFIENNDKTVYSDNLVSFASASPKFDDETIMANLRNNGFRYIYYSPQDISYFGDSEFFDSIKNNFSRFLSNNKNDLRRIPTAAGDEVYFFEIQPH